MEEEGGERGPNGGSMIELGLRIYLLIPALRIDRQEKEWRNCLRSHRTYVVGAWPSVV